MIKIKVKNINQALKELKGKVYKSRMMIELREREEYTKKSVKRRKEIQRAAYRQKKKRESE
jgi:small subunit ribosomal protein S21